MDNYRYLSFWGGAVQGRRAAEQEEELRDTMLSLRYDEAIVDDYIEIAAEHGFRGAAEERYGEGALTEFRILHEDGATVFVAILYNPPHGITWGVVDNPIEYVDRPAVPIDTRIGADAAIAR